jgi:hypothetical protein
MEEHRWSIIVDGVEFWQGTEEKALKEVTARILDSDYTYQAKDVVIHIPAGHKLEIKPYVPFGKSGEGEAMKKEREEAIGKLKEILQEGDTVYTILRHVSRSGMLRHISCLVIKDNEPLLLDYWVAKSLDRKLAKTGEGIKESGCGMDMGFHLVHSLSCALFGYDNGGGYKLNQRWL